MTQTATLTCVLLSLSLVACGGLVTCSNKDYDANQPHHRLDGFVNRYAGRSDKFGLLLRWQWERFRDGLPKAPKAPILGVAPDLDLIHSQSLAPRVTWIGHATMLVQVDGLNILTDPHWGWRASPVPFAGPKRHQAPGVPFDRLPPIHAVVISHNHWDHLDRDTVQSLMDRHEGIRFFVPLGVQRWFKDKIRGATIAGPSANVVALDWDQSYSLHGKTHPLQLHFLAVQHWSARGLFDRSQTLWGSWAMIHPTWRFWFSGDLAYSPDSADIGKRFGGFDLAAIAIGAYEPRWFMKDAHINPAEAVQVMMDVRAKSAIAIHWGTFDALSDESLDQPPKELQKAMMGLVPQPDFRALKHGESWVGKRRERLEHE